MSGAPDWELCMNHTSPAELRALSEEVFDLSRAPAANDALESRVCFACNSMMDGDGGWTFTRTMGGALGFISHLLRLRAGELDRLRPSYCLASADTHPKDGNSTEIEVPLVSGAVPSEASADAPPSAPSLQTPQGGDS